MEFRKFADTWYVSLWFTTHLRHSWCVVYVNLLVTCWITQQRLPFKILSLWTLLMEIRLHNLVYSTCFGCPYIHSVRILLDLQSKHTAFKPLWVSGVNGASRSCQSSAESLSRIWLLSFSLSCSSFLNRAQIYKIYCWNWMHRFKYTTELLSSYVR